MNPTRRFLLGCTAALLLPLPALAERMFPKGTVRGTIRFVQGKEVILNGQREFMSPGARVLDEKNRLPLRGSLDGKTYTVNYVRDPSGKIRKVWLLTEREMQKSMPVDAAAQRYQQEQQIRMKTLYMN